MRPHDIEARSFAIIDREAGPHDFPADRWAIVRRMIHTSADFEYLRSVRFHPDAVTAGVSAIRRGCRIVTDTHMLRAGIGAYRLAPFGVELRCFITDPAVAEQARVEGRTRASAAVDAAAGEIHGGICAIGNAPTALLRLIEGVREGRNRPALIVGLPVGFVNAAESKAELEALAVPFITNRGRKGGSNVAASVVNALAILAAEPLDPLEPMPCTPNP